MRPLTGWGGPLRGLGTPDPHPALRDQAEGQLADLLRASGIPRSGVYRPGEVCRLLRISRTTLLQLCALREHPAVGHPNPRGLGSFLVGCHHRIPHEALVVRFIKILTKIYYHHCHLYS